MTNRISLRSLGSATALAAALAGCSAGEDPKPRAPNVVLICLDTVRADHLGFYGHSRPTTPNLDALAGRSLVFLDASATAGWTKPSVPSFLTGTYPCQHGVYEGSAKHETGSFTDLLPESALTLAEVFLERGYRTGAVVHNAQLRAGNGFEQGFETYDQGYMDAREIRWRGLDWMDGEDARPFFLYLHFLDAHWPYPTPDEWVEHFAPAASTQRFRGKQSKTLYSAINGGQYEMTDDDRQALETVYDTALAYLDSELGRLFEGLEQRGLSENTIVCIVSDHGEEFGEHGRLGHGHGLWENLLRVPWILHLPGTRPARNSTPVSLVDLFPTLLAAAGLPYPADVEGVNRLAEPDVARAIFAEHKSPDHYLQSLRTGPEKLQRTFTAPKSASVATLVMPISIGSRWEVEFIEVNGEFFATQLKPRKEDVDRPPEMKGNIAALGPTGFQLAGIPVKYDERTSRQTEPGVTVPDLAEGMLVKVRGPYRAGVLLAERIRIYPDDQENPLEIRGTVEGIQLEGRRGKLVLSSFTVTLTRKTEIKGVENVKEPRFTRLHVVELLEGGDPATAEEAGFSAQRSLFDLARDPTELSPLQAENGTELELQLEALGARLVRGRIFAEGDAKTLDADALEELREIGYAGDE